MRTNMQKTSLLAYAEVKKTLTPREKDVIGVFRDNPTMDFTNMELLHAVNESNDLNLQICSITGRVYRLRGKGGNNPYQTRPHLIESRKRECEITGSTAIAWQLNNE